MSDHVLLGDEAVALGARHAGISLAYGYPGTPSTEILEYLMAHPPMGEKTEAHWCSNEKTAYEAAMGASLMGLRSLVTMKHVGLNVAADPFINSALANIKGGIVLAVADDPGMHSSQGEQDSRFYADYAKVLCFEPRSQQEAYRMTREAFDVSEKFHIPVMVKLLTRLSHSRAVVTDKPPRDRNRPEKFADPTDYMVLPAISRKNYALLLEQQDEFEAWSESHEANVLTPAEDFDEFAVITTGLARNYYEENLPDLPGRPAHLHVSVYPIPREKVKKLAQTAGRIVVLEEGQPFLETRLRGLLPQALKITGKIDGVVPPAGELNPDNVRPALGLEPMRTDFAVPDSLPGRPPQLCAGCPHDDTYNALNAALSEHGTSLVTSDIGCYTLGYLPPHQAIETSLCMGASIPMARGAADAGMRPAVATIGDSTFMHSGLTGLADAAAADVPMTLIIMDNGTTAMTGGQETVVASPRIREAVLGLGVPEEHVVTLNPLPKNHEENTAALQRELAHEGTSVVITVRECVVTLKKKYAEKRLARDSQ